MTTFFQKIFLSKDKRAILDAIEQNADKIDYTYNETGTYIRHTFTISTPTVELLSVLETPSGKITYQFVQYKPDGQVLKSNQGEASKFSANVHNELYRKYVETRSVKALYSKRAGRTK